MPNGGEDAVAHWHPRQRSPHVVLASIRLGVLRRFREDAKSWDSEDFRQDEVTLPGAFNLLPESGNLTYNHIFRFRTNPYGISPVDKAPPPMTDAVIAFVQERYRPILKASTSRSLAEMEHYVDHKGASKAKTLVSFQNHYGGLIELLSQGIRSVDSQAVVCQYHSWRAYIHTRIHSTARKKGVDKERATMKIEAREQLAILQKIHIPTRSPLASLYHFQNLTNEMDILAELATLGAVKASLIKTRAVETEYFQKVLWFNSLFPWRIEEPTQALIIAAHTDDGQAQLEKFGKLALHAVARALRCAVDTQGIFDRTHPVITYQQPLFEDEKPLKTQKILENYLEKIHLNLVKQLNLKEFFP
ncbi:hypothetical protein [Rhizobium sullae]|uniref:Uncharacterized protein n=1 Tax=Rhizobium sullae TaxID=50338 RepID=A0A4R3Q0J4_RHISU|nr:hypothetical protein [Rhizobium sullae]TCU13737.1 hypothetical protein EV132_111170 [Rhizobium sullae]